MDLPMESGLLSKCVSSTVNAFGTTGAALLVAIGWEL